MIVATRIPMLTEQMKAATLRLAQAQRDNAAGAVAEAAPNREPVRRLVAQLERLGYRVTLDGRAA